MASRTSRKEWVRGLPSAFGVGRYDRKRVHWASERSVRYVFLIGDSVRNHPNPHPYQTGSQRPKAKCSITASLTNTTNLRQAPLVRFTLKRQGARMILTSETTKSRSVTVS